MTRRWLPLGLLLGLSLPFLGKPVHLDDANFLRLAQGARLDPWRPHDVLINWQGHTERAFDVLSNPPGVAWFLAPWVGQPVWVLHLVMLAWLPLAVWGALRLGDQLGGRGDAAALLIVGSPIAVWASGALTPDLPLLAVTLAGMAGLVGAPRLDRAWPWALLLGTGALFRYSGLALIPLVPLWAALSGQARAGAKLSLAALAPAAALALHDVHAYGSIHLLAMVGFQSVSNAPADLAHKGAATLGALGGAAALPLLALARPRAAALGALIGLGLGLLTAARLGHTGVAALATVLAVTAGGASLGAAVRNRRRDEILLTSWLVLGLAFQLTLRFSAARYGLPFLAPLVLLPLRAAGPRLVWAAVGGTLALAGLLAIDDLRLARAQEALAQDVLDAARGERGVVAGHWGWQHHLEAAGWTALEEDAPLPSGTLIARSEVAWPQTPAAGAEEEIGRWTVTDPWPAPRVHTREGAGNLHASQIAAEPPIETVAPWSWGRDPLDTVTLSRRR